MCPNFLNPSLLKECACPKVEIQSSRWKRRAVAVGASAALGFGVVAGTGTASAVPLFSDTWKTLGLGHIVGLLDDPAVQNYVSNKCTSGNVASVDVHGVTVDCSRSTGNGTAAVLPGGIDLAQNDHVKYTLTADGVPIQIGDGGPSTVDIEIENMNLIQIVSGAALDPMFDLYNPLTAYEFRTYQEVVDAAKLPVQSSTEDKCLFQGVLSSGKCHALIVLLGGSKFPRAPMRTS